MLEPKTLQDAVVYFASPDNCVSYLVARRWPNGVVCPTCGSNGPVFLPSRRLWQCKTRHPQCQFSIKVGTIFESSHIALRLWLQAIFLIASSKKGISSNQLHRTMGITLKSAWFMSHRIREAMRSGDFAPFGATSPPMQGSVSGPRSFSWPWEDCSGVASKERTFFYSRCLSFKFLLGCSPPICMHGSRFRF